MNTELKYQLHPWHGVGIGENAPHACTAFIEIVPTDTIKYEVDKESGILKVDRPQKFSNVFPGLYGFLPRTLCDLEVADRCMEKTGRAAIMGDQDPLDIVVLTEKIIAHGGILVQAIPIGGFRMIDQNQADDKIVAIMKGDEVYGMWQDITEVNDAIVERLKHYFLTYKKGPGDTVNRVQIEETYNREEAYEVIRRSQLDYFNRFNA